VVEELHAFLHILGSLLRPGDGIDDGQPLRLSQLIERLLVPLPAFSVEPGKPLPQALAVGGILHHDVVHELGHVRVARAAGTLVLRDGDVGQDALGAELGLGKELRSERSAGFPRPPRRPLPAVRGAAAGAAHHGHAEDAEHVPAGEIGQTAPPFRWRVMYSAVRMASAMMVQVGFLSAWETNGPPSETKRFFTSWAWHHSLTTEREGSFPIRVVPISWMMRPPVAIPYPFSRVGIGEKTSPPISSMSARKVSCMCFTWRYSWSLHSQWNRSAGMPQRSFTSGSISQKLRSLGIISPRPENPMVVP